MGYLLHKWKGCIWKSIGFLIKNFLSACININKYKCQILQVSKFRDIRCTARDELSLPHFGLEVVKKWKIMLLFLASAHHLHCKCTHVFNSDVYPAVFNGAYFQVSTHSTADLVDNIGNAQIIRHIPQAPLTFPQKSQLVQHAQCFGIWVFLPASVLSSPFSSWR